MVSKMIYVQKKIAWYLILMLISVRAVAQNTLPSAYSSGIVVNSTRTWEAKRPLVNEADVISSARTLQEVHQSTAYYDGLGRSLQTVAKQASPLLNDIVSPVLYDASGREQFKYLPFASNVAQSGDITNDGNLKMDPFQQQVAFYNSQLTGQPGETNVGSSNLNWAYSQNNFEASPFNRVVATYAPGVSWVGSQLAGSTHAVQKQYYINTSIDNVREWSIAAAQGSIPTSSGAYPANELFKTISVDEQGLQTIEFQDLYGQLVLKKIQLSAVADTGAGSPHAGWLCTYYVYDDNANLRFVISPDVVQQIDGTWVISQSLADELCFRYEYDALSRVIIKKVPGTPTGATGEVWIVYDQWNRPVLSQTGNLRLQNQWIYVKYDGLDRLIITGIYTDATHTSQASMQSYLLSQNLARSESFQTGSFPQYTLGNSFPSVASGTILNIKYYDGYAWGNSYGAYSTKDNSYDGFFATASNASFPYAQSLTQSTQTRGLITGYWDNTAYLEAYFYDSRERVIQTKTNNQSTGIDILTSQYGFAGLKLETYLRHQKNGTNPQTHNVTSAMTYDAMGRLLIVTKTVNSTVNGVAVNTATKTIAANQYNELSKLQKKTLGNNLESLTSDYNVRGWLLGENRSYLSGASNSNYFGFEVGYDKTACSAGTTGFSYPLFNGNVAGTEWKSKGDGVGRKYDFKYDNDRRFMRAEFVQNASGNTWNNTPLDFTVWGFDQDNGYGVKYDPNGNIQMMIQDGWKGVSEATVDALRYNYYPNTNRLQYVSDDYNDPNSTLGDFHYTGAKTSSSVDYGYDADGNITSDFNHAISTVTFNYLNLPLLYTFSNNKGSIQYIYDVAGNKLEKITTENNATVSYNGSNFSSNITTTIKYISGFVYKTLVYSNASLAPLQYTDVLQFFADEEGRIRFIPAVGTAPANFVFDYFIRDYVHNVRMVLTDEQQQDVYPAATLETATYNGGTAESLESQYYTINTGDMVATSSLPWWSSASGSSYQNQNNNGNPVNNDPYSNTSATSTQVYHLNGQTGDKYGLGITIKVMSGDQISIFAKSVWNNNGQGIQAFPITSVLSTFVNAFATTSTVIAGSHGLATGTALNGNSLITSPLNSLLTNTPNQSNPTTAPKAAINWILFNDQFIPVSVGTDLVNSTSNLVKSHSILNSPMTCNGYLYVYCSNETNMDVYFDNLQVVNSRGPILEETHYYPFGLTMAAISDKAWNKLPNFLHYNGMEMQNQEFSNGSGLELYDYTHRFYDQQIGRFVSQDRLADNFPHYSPYQFAGNQVGTTFDLDGLEPVSSSEGDDPTVDISADYGNNWGQEIVNMYDPSAITAGTSLTGDFSVMSYFNDPDFKFYWKNNDGTSGFYSPETARENNHWTGYWQHYLTPDQLDAQAGAESADLLEEGIATLITLPFVVAGAMEGGIAAAAYVESQGGIATVAANTANFVLPQVGTQNLAGAGVDFAYQTIVQGRGLSEVNFGTVVTSGFLGSGSLLKASIWQASGNFVNLSYQGFKDDKVLNFDKGGVENFAFGTIGNLTGNYLGKQAQLAEPGLINKNGAIMGNVIAKYFEFSSGILGSEAGDALKQSTFGAH